MSQTVNKILSQRQNDHGPVIPDDCTPSEVAEIKNFVHRYETAIAQGDRKAFQQVMAEYRTLVDADIEVLAEVAGWMFDKAIRERSGLKGNSL